MRKRSPAFLSALLLLSLSGSLILPAGREGVERAPVGSSSDITFFVPFLLDSDGNFYAKLLVVPWSPVNNGTPNGSLDPLSGWFVRFTLGDSTGSPLGPDSGPHARIDSTPTPTIALSGGTRYTLLFTVHVPSEGAREKAEYRIPFALAISSKGQGGSGATLDESVGFTARILVGDREGPESLPPPQGPSPTESKQGSWADLLLPLAGISILLFALVLLVLWARRLEP